MTTVTLVTTFGHIHATGPDGAVLGGWDYPTNGTPGGWVEGGSSHSDFMEWLFAVSGTPKVWVAVETSGVAYFLTHLDGMLGYTYLHRDTGAPDWSQAGLCEDPGEIEPAIFAEWKAAAKTLTEFHTAVPALVSAL